MASVAAALAFIFPNEGGLSDHKSDRGGRTNMGITQATLDRARKARPKAGYPAKVDGLTHAQAADIYEKDFVPEGFKDIKDQRIGTVLMDMGVNSGPERAEVLMQRACNALGAGLKVDGAIGPKTIAAINALDPEALLVAYRQQRILYYHQIVDRDPAQVEFLAGWINRANRVPPLEV